MSGHGSGKEVGSVDVNAPELAHAINGIVNGLVVLGEPGAGNEVVNLAVLADNVINAGLDAIRVGDISVMGSDLGCAGRAWVLPAECLNQGSSLLLGFVSCIVKSG
jgi:hypothetical protein